MVKPRSKISYCVKSPQFFKIFLPHQCSHRLRIPPEFLKYLKGVFPSKSILRSPAKRSWRVDVNKNNCQKEIAITSRMTDKPLIHLQGSQTTEPNKSKELIDNRELGTHMTLRSRVPMAKQENDGAHEAAGKLAPKNLASNMLNKSAPTHHVLGGVHCADKSKELIDSREQGTRMTLRSRVPMAKQENDGAHEAASKLAPKNLAPNMLNKSALTHRVLGGVHCANKSKELIDGREQGTHMTLRSRVPMAKQENDGAREVAGKLAPKNPFFELVLTPTYVRKGYPNIPVIFHKSYLEKRRSTATLQLSNKTWLVHLIVHGTKLCIGRGWAPFVQENTLQVGDACTFELIEREKYVFNVSIRRDKGIPKKA